LSLRRLSQRLRSSPYRRDRPRCSRTSGHRSNLMLMDEWPMTVWILDESRRSGMAPFGQSMRHCLDV